MKEIKVHAWDVLRMIPDEELAHLAKDTKVDYCAKALSGERMFYLLVFAFLSAEQVSQRKLETVFNNDLFKTLFNLSVDAKVSRSSISTRLSKIELSFFEKAFALIYSKLSALYAPSELLKYHIVPVDSTMVAETCNKLKEGFTVGRKPRGGKEPVRQIKYSMVYDGFVARLTEVFNKATYLCEDVALPEVILKDIKKESGHACLYVIDRGLCSLESFDAINKEEAKFVGRIKTSRKMKVARSLMDEHTKTDLGKLELVEDIVVHLYDNERKCYSESEYRIVKARFKKPRDTTRPANKGQVRRVENEVFFITNEMELTAGEVAEIYKKRWKIEVFFKFLKQNLSFSHLISTSENGIKVVLYMTLITAMLVLIYKRENELGYTIAKFSFFLEMQSWVGKLMVVINGGDLNRTAYERICIRGKVP